MTRFTSHSVALFAALLATVASMNAIVTVPPAQAAMIAAPVLA